MADFAEQIKAFRDKALANFTTVVQEATVGIATELVRRTPIDITTLRANWQFAPGTPPTDDHPEAVDESPQGADTAAVLAAEIREVPAGGITYLRNNRPYMEKIEYGLYTNIHGHKRNSGRTVDGFSTQAPAGVIRVTAEEWEESFVKPAVAKLKV